MGLEAPRLSVPSISEQQRTLLKDKSQLTAIIEHFVPPGELHEEALAAIKRLSEQSLIGIVCREMVNTVNTLERKT